MAINSARSWAGAVASSCCSRARSARSVSAWELTETYSPAAMDMAPATSPATPATTTWCCVASAAATPMIRLAVDTMPSFAPSTAARSQPIRPERWISRWRGGMRRVVRRPLGGGAPYRPGQLGQIFLCSLECAPFPAPREVGEEPAVPRHVHPVPAPVETGADVPSVRAGGVLIDPADAAAAHRLAAPAFRSSRFHERLLRLRLGVKTAPPPRRWLVRMGRRNLQVRRRAR